MHRKFADNSHGALPQELEAPAAVGILFNLPEELQIPVVLRALICAHEAGRQSRARELGAAALADVRLSSSRTQ